MKVYFSFVFIWIFFAFSTEVALSQSKNHVDHKPSYRKWQDDYIVDKIEYTKDRTIFYFRFVCKSGKYTSAIFYPPGGKHPWYLKGRNVRKNFYLKEIRNVRRNGKLMKSRVRSSAYSINAVDGIGYTVFSCEVHFDRIPNNVKVVDLIEGPGQEYNKNHFNCFRVTLKQRDDNDLGSEKDSNKKVSDFQKKYGVKLKPKPKPKPKPEPKPEPEPEPEPDTIAEQKVEEKSLPKIIEEIKPVEQAYSTSRLSSQKDINCGEMLVLDKIKFHDNSTKFKGMVAANRTLFILFNYMKEHPKSSLILYGHTDIFGPEQFNMELSKARVVKIQRWLSMYGIKQHRINYEWFGPKQPLDPKGNPINRRVEIKVNCRT